MTNRWLWIRPPLHGSILGWNNVSSVINEFCSARSFSTDINSKFLCFLVSSEIWMTNRVWSKRAASQFVSCTPFCSPCYNLIQWKGVHLGRWSSKQAGSERRCPHVRLGQPIYTLPFLSPCLSTFTCFLSTFHSSALPPLRSLAEFRTGLHFPGHLGWWSPLPQGLGRPLGLPLEENMGNNMQKKIKIKKSVEDCVYSSCSKVVWHS